MWTIALGGGPLALHLIKHAHGTVNGCFSSSFSVAYPPYCVTFHFESLELPLGVQISSHCVPPISCVGRPVFWKNNCLCINAGFYVDFSHVTPYRHLYLSTPYHFSLLGAHRGFNTILACARAHGRGEIVQLLLKLPRIHSSWQESFATSPMAHTLYNLYHYCLSEDGINAAIFGAKLVGLGVGLTPSGDDFLTAFISAMYLLDFPYHGQPFTATFLHELKNRLSPKNTNIWGWSILWPALHGWIASNFADIFEELSNGTHISAIERQVKIGSSSATDQLLGLAMALRIYYLLLQKEHSSTKQLVTSTKENREAKYENFNL